MDRISYFSSIDPKVPVSNLHKKIFLKKDAALHLFFIWRGGIQNVKL